MPIVLAPTSTQPTTASDLLNITRNRYLLAGMTEGRNRLNAPYTPGDTTLQFQYDIPNISQGSILCIGLTTFYVWSVDRNAKTAEVEAGYRGSYDEYASFGAVVDINPRYLIFDIFQALNEEIAALSSPGVGLYQTKQIELTYNPSLIGYDLPGITELTDILELRYAEPNQYKRTPRLERHDWRLERNNLASEFSSTFSLKLMRGWPGQPVTIVYKAPFSPFATLADAMDTSGIPDHMRDIPPLGAALRLGAGREVRRNQTESQGDTRRGSEVPPGAVAGSFRGLAAMRQQRIMEEVQRLQAAYPPRRG